MACAADSADARVVAAHRAAVPAGRRATTGRHPPLSAGSGSAWARGQAPGPADEEREVLDELHREHRIPGACETDPLPMIGLAQLYRRDVPGLPEGPGDCDPLQVFWSPFNAHGPGRYDLELRTRRRRS